MRIFLLLGLLTVFIATNGQINAGVKVGAGFCSLDRTVNPIPGSGSMDGFYNGIFFIIPLNKKLSLQPELNFMTVGGRFTGFQAIPADATGLPVNSPNAFMDCKKTISLDYIEMPLLLRVQGTGIFSWNIVFGPSIAILADNPKARYKGTGIVYRDEQSDEPVAADKPLLPVTVDYEARLPRRNTSLNYFLQGGLGFHYSSTVGTLFIEGRTIMGIKPLDLELAGGKKVRAGSLVISGGLIFPFER